jgi:urease accessory protein
MGASRAPRLRPVERVRPHVDTETLLASLQNADSFFPGGGIAFSWGLETSIADGLVRGAPQATAFVEGQLTQRWAVCDRVALVAAYRATDMREIQHIDREVEVMTLALELRAGSRRAGTALLAVHERLGTAGAAAYRRLIRSGEAQGHLPVMQGCLWRATGMSEQSVQGASAHSFCVGLLSAALRLGALGHIHSQQALIQLRPLMALLIAQPVPPWEEMYTCTPAAEIAAMRHEVQSSRLFAN